METVPCAPDLPALTERKTTRSIAFEHTLVGEHARATPRAPPRGAGSSRSLRDPPVYSAAADDRRLCAREGRCRSSRAPPASWKLRCQRCRLTAIISASNCSRLFIAPRTR